MQLEGFSLIYGYVLERFSLIYGYVLERFSLIYGYVLEKCRIFAHKYQLFESCTMTTNPSIKKMESKANTQTTCHTWCSTGG